MQNIGQTSSLSSIFNSSIQTSNVSKLSNISPDGHIVKMKALYNNHFNYIDKTEPASANFLDYLKGSVLDTNDSIVSAELLQQQLIVDPDNTNIDEVTIAAKEAEVALNLTKSIINKLITGYKELINIR